MLMDHVAGALGHNRRVPETMCRKGIAVRLSACLAYATARSGRWLLKHARTMQNPKSLFGWIPAACRS